MNELVVSCEQISLLIKTQNQENIIKKTLITRFAAMQYQNKCQQQQNKMQPPLPNKKSYQNDNCKKTHKIKGDNTFYSPVKNFSNNLQPKKQKTEQEDISPWQTSNDDQLNSTGLDFRMKTSVKNKKSREQKKVDEFDHFFQSHTPKSTKSSNYQQSYNTPQYRNEEKESNLNRSNIIFDKQTHSMQNCTIQKEQFSIFDEGEHQIINPSMQELQIMENNKQTQQSNDSKNVQQQLLQLEMTQQNQLIANIRKQRAIYVQLLQRTKQSSQDHSKIGLLKTSINGNQMTSHSNQFVQYSNQFIQNSNQLTYNSSQFIQHQKDERNNSFCRNTMNKELIGGVYSDNKRNESLITDQNRQNNIQLELDNKVQPIFQEESITTKNKNRILNILDNVLSNPKKLIKHRETTNNPNNTFYSLSHKASMIQRNIELQSKTNKKLSEQYQQVFQNNKRLTKDEHQKSNIICSNIIQSDQVSLLLRRQSKTQDVVQDYYVDSNDNNQNGTTNKYYKNLKEQEVNDSQEGKQNLKLNLSSNLSDKKRGLHSYLLNQQKAGIISSIIPSTSKNDQNNSSDLYFQESQIKTHDKDTKNVYQDIRENNQAAYEKHSTNINLNVQQEMKQNKLNSHRMKTCDDSNEEFHHSMKQSQQITNQNSKNLSILLPLFKGRNTNKEYRRVIKKMQRMQDISPQQRRNTDCNQNQSISKVDYNQIFNEDDNQNIYQEITQQQGSLPPINKEYIMKKANNSFQIDSSHIINVRTNKRKSITPNKTIQSFKPTTTTDNTICMSQLNRNIFSNEVLSPPNDSNIDHQTAKQTPLFVSSDRNLNKNIQKSIILNSQETNYNISTTPKRQGLDYFKSQTHSSSSYGKNNQQIQRQTQISTKKQKELISYYKPSSLIQSDLCSSQSIIAKNLSNSLIQ